MRRLLNNISQIVTLTDALAKDGRNLCPADLSVIRNGAIAFDDNNILWVGESANLPTTYRNIDNQIDCTNHIVLPEIVDSHTHLIFGGDRAHEYSMRLNGADYQEIARSGGGILNTVEGTNALSKQELYELCISRIEQINSYGVGTIEIKSGYGLNLDKERELTYIIDRLKKHFSPHVKIFNTYMAAHAVPADFENSSKYMNEVVIPLLEELAPHNIIDAVDIFHEDGYFTKSDVLLLFDLCKSLGLKIKIHADEFNDNQGAVIASQHNALSSDHLLKTGPDGIHALSNSSTVATLLPGTGFFLGKPQADGRALLNAGCKVAIASDFNPGSCHCDNLLLLASFAATQYKMNIAELICAITLNASHALDLHDQGAIAPGLQPRFSFFATKSIEQLVYNWGRNSSTNLMPQ